MITLEKLEIYNRFQGDIDSWSRMGSMKERSIMNDDDWFLIDSIIQDVKLEKSGIASKGFLENLYKILKEKCDGEETVNQIKKIADK